MCAGFRLWVSKRWGWHFKPSTLIDCRPSTSLFGANQIELYAVYVICCIYTAISNIHSDAAFYAHDLYALLGIWFINQRIYHGICAVSSQPANSSHFPAPSYYPLIMARSLVPWCPWTLLHIDFLMASSRNEGSFLGPAHTAVPFRIIYFNRRNNASLSLPHFPTIFHLNPSTLALFCAAACVAHSSTGGNAGTT